MQNEYKELLRQTHLAALKQKYLDAVADAKLKKDRLEEAYRDDTQDAYIARRRDERDAPQKLRALGLGGGVEDEEMRGILTEYQNKLNELARGRQRYLEDYERTVSQQTQLMNNAIAEYNARIALEDYNAAQSASKSRSGSRSGASKSKTNTSKAQNDTPATPQIPGQQLYGPKKGYSIRTGNGRW